MASSACWRFDQHLRVDYRGRIERPVQARERRLRQCVGEPLRGRDTDKDGRRQPSDNEFKIARFQGTHVARIAKKQST